MIVASIEIRASFVMYSHLHELKNSLGHLYHQHGKKRKQWLTYL